MGKFSKSHNQNVGAVKGESFGWDKQVRVGWFSNFAIINQLLLLIKSTLRFTIVLLFVNQSTLFHNNPVVAFLSIDDS